jgi:hypothetical protein
LHTREPVEEIVMGPARTRFSSLVTSIVELMVAGFFNAPDLIEETWPDIPLMSPVAETGCPDSRGAPILIMIVLYDAESKTDKYKATDPVVTVKTKASVLTATIFPWTSSTDVPAGISSPVTKEVPERVTVTFAVVVAWVFEIRQPMMTSVESAV